MLALIKILINRWYEDISAPSSYILSWQIFRDTGKWIIDYEADKRYLMSAVWQLYKWCTRQKNRIWSIPYTVVSPADHITHWSYRFLMPVFVQIRNETLLFSSDSLYLGTNIFVSFDQNTSTWAALEFHHTPTAFNYSIYQRCIGVFNLARFKDEANGMDCLQHYGCEMNLK